MPVLAISRRKHKFDSFGLNNKQSVEDVVLCLVQYMAGSRWQSGSGLF